MAFTIHHGDCREVMATLDAESVDAIVSDPPYGLSFMGKGWDHGVPGVEFWTEALRVAKPGAHLLAFGGTRTYHRLACAIEDAGWEIRDCVMWVYGSGFPKSHDVSKAIDKMDAGEEQERRRRRFTAWVRSTGITSRQIDEATGTNMGGHYTTAASQPAIMTREHLEQCRHLLGDVPEWVEREADIRSVESENFKRREVLGTETRYNEPNGIVSAGRDERTLVERKVTAAHTEAARQWSGWGTALKPAWEPIIVARKPLVGTVAENVLTHGTGAINVDGCRVEATDFAPKDRVGAAKLMEDRPWQTRQAEGGRPRITEGNTLGRWPANLIHDGSEEVVGLFPAAGGGSGKPIHAGDFGKHGRYGKASGATTESYADSGSAARFFYCAKASKADRGGDNKHPTVKPTDLMRYLCRLVTPPGGVVLDPFTGSGSTGKAATLEGFRFIGIEREAEYVEIAKARIAAVDAGAGPLFA